MSRCGWKKIILKIPSFHFSPYPLSQLYFLILLLIGAFLPFLQPPPATISNFQAPPFIFHLQDDHYTTKIVPSIDQSGAPLSTISSTSHIKLTSSLQNHHQRPRRDQHTPNQRLHRKFLMQEQKRQRQCQHRAHLIDRHDFGCLTNLQRPVITKP